MNPMLVSTESPRARAAGIDDDDERSVFPAIVSLSLILHIGVGVLTPNMPGLGVHESFESSQVVLEAPPPPPPPPPPEPLPEPAPTTPSPPKAARVVATKPTVLEASSSVSDVKIDAVIGETAAMPSSPPPPEPAVVATPAPVAAPSPRVDPGPTIVPAKSLGRLPRAPALDRELERNYPADAKRAGVAGTATLRLQVLSDGRLGRVQHLSESHPGFGSACERTVRSARWDPPLDRESRPVATEIKYVCKFEVRS